MQFPATVTCVTASREKETAYDFYFTSCNLSVTTESGMINTDQDRVLPLSGCDPCGPRIT